MDDEQRRHEQEVEYWWKQTSGKPAAIRALLERLKAENKRSPAGIEKLRQGLMEKWRSEQ